MLRRVLRRLKKLAGDPPSPGPTPESRSRPAYTSEPEPVVDDESDTVDNVEIDTADLKNWLEQGSEFILVDIREPHELRLGHATSALLLRMNDIPNLLDELPEKDTRLVIYCAAGSRSFGVAHWLREQGWEDSWSLESGFHGVVEAGMDVARPSDKPG